MGNLMREVRAWLDDAEKFIKLLREEKDPKEERNIQEKIEVSFFPDKVNCNKQAIVILRLRFHRSRPQSLRA